MAASNVTSPAPSPAAANSNDQPLTIVVSACSSVGVADFSQVSTNDKSSNEPATVDNQSSATKAVLTESQRRHQMTAAAVNFKADLKDSMDDMQNKGWFLYPSQKLEAYDNGVKLLSTQHPLAISHSVTHWCSHQTVVPCPVSGSFIVIWTHNSTSTARVYIPSAASRDWRESRLARVATGASRDWRD